VWLTGGVVCCKSPVAGAWPLILVLLYGHSAVFVENESRSCRRVGCFVGLVCHPRMVHTYCNMMLLATNCVPLAAVNYAPGLLHAVRL
jgi:hypothetical protein